MKLCIVQPTLAAPSETFLRAHATLLPFDTTVVHFDNDNPCIDNNRVLSQTIFAKLYRKLYGKITQKHETWETTQALKKIFQQHADIILAEYGPIGVRCCEAARATGIPLITHFHGYDASKYAVIKKHEINYQKLFHQSSAIVVVSNKMVTDLVNIGAPAEKIHLNPCGVDTDVFKGAKPEKASQVMVAVGRFVEKKAPYLTITAFAQTLQKVPNAKLVMLGDGPLKGVCKDLAEALGISNSVRFMGASSHTQVKDSLLQARAFVQHSIQSSDGDCEGTPVGVMEAQSAGLPVVATSHAGIADVVVHGETGFLIEEKDVSGMAAFMTQLFQEPDLASELGKNGRKRIKKNYSMKIHIDKLGGILKRCLGNEVV